jgi:hypothetical protein
MSVVLEPTTAATVASKPATTFKPLYFKDPFSDLIFLDTLCKHAFERSEIGECYSAAAQIHEGDVQSWREAWSTLVEKVEALARSTEAKGHRVSARQSYLESITDCGVIMLRGPGRCPQRCHSPTPHTIARRAA